MIIIIIITARQQCHAVLNDRIWRAIKRALIPVAKKPVSLTITDGKRPDGSTLTPWSRSKLLNWNIPVPDMLNSVSKKHLFSLVLMQT